MSLFTYLFTPSPVMASGADTQQKIDEVTVDGNKTLDAATNDRSSEATTVWKKFQKKVGSLQMPFIKNVGQTDKSVAYYAPTFGGTVFVTNEGQIVYSLTKEGEEEGKTKSVTLKETVIGGAVLITGREPAVTQVSYFKGNDESNWQSNITICSAWENYTRASASACMLMATTLKNCLWWRQARNQSKSY